MNNIDRQYIAVASFFKEALDRPLNEGRPNDVHELATCMKQLAEVIKEDIKGEPTNSAEKGK
jgi:hypothetical protein